MQEISNAIVQTNPLLLTTSDKGLLSTDYRRNSYFKEHFCVIEPIEYLYNRDHNNYFVYGPVTKVLETFLGRADFLDQIVFNEKALPGLLKSFQDGTYYKENKLLGQQNTCISLALYIDDFEICNPLGTSRKLHKITAVYWVVLNLPAKYRSSLTSIQLALFGKSEDVKQYGYEKFLEPLIKDIQCLEEEGIFVEILGQFVKGAVFCVSADNLGAHSLAGFYESFNVEKFCRFCLISRDQIATTEVKDFQLRDVDEHDTFLEELIHWYIEHLRSYELVEPHCAEIVALDPWWKSDGHHKIIHSPLKKPKMVCCLFTLNGLFNDDLILFIK